MLPILLPLTVQNPVLTILWIIICLALVLFVAFLGWVDYSSVAYFDEKGHEQHLPNLPEYVYKAIMRVDEWNFFTRPTLFKWLDKHGEVRIDEGHVMRKLSDGLYGDDSGNSWTVYKIPTCCWVVRRCSGTSSNKK
jgi:hypothetical protein